MYAVIVVVVQSLAFGILFMIAILVFRNDFSIIFTDDNQLQMAVSDIAYLLAITMVLNSIQPVISGQILLHDSWPFNIEFLIYTLQRKAML
jgi:multidrug resistance protein, MATE family